MKTSFLCGCVWLLAALSLRSETLFEYFGEAEFPFDQAHPPAIVEGNLGTLRELEFRNGEGEEERNFLRIPIPQGDYESLTIALFVRPERRDLNEDLVNNKWDTGDSGFRLQKSWTRWLFAVGDGEQSARTAKVNRDGELLTESWQHLAVTFHDGEVHLYRDGLLIHQETLAVRVIRLEGVMHIGMGQGNAYGFTGRMGGIYVATKTLDEAGIQGLLQRGNP